jgi:DNA mismatch repair protein MutL
VIDRPAALVRELTDNAIDAGGKLIEVHIEGGGIVRTEVIDDGSGMEKEDLELCWRTHATSKIRSLADLATADTLGFRGEALAAAAAVARLEICTSTGGREAWELELAPGREALITQTRRTRGTGVRTRGLFDALPARKRFLKREGAEGNLCRQALIDKALAFPHLSFRFIQDGRLACFLPPAASLGERFAAALLDGPEGALLHEIAVQGSGFKITIVIGGPDLFRRDRRRQYLFANGRRIQDFSLLQALEYGVQGWFPNGTHPVGAVYVEIDPALADFNIHPAKREVRFSDAAAVHHAISSALADFIHRRNSRFNLRRLGAEQREWFSTPRPETREESAPSGPGHPAGPGTIPAALAMEALGENRSSPSGPEGGRRGNSVEESAPGYGTLRLGGRAFGLFILAERGDRLFIIDQHAAHERILYDRFLSGPVPRQELLAPIPFTTEGEEEDRFLERRREELARLGIVIGGNPGDWTIEALPVNWRKTDGETIAEILDLKNAGENIAERWAATLSCHGAVKDGDYLDDGAALALAEEALRLPVPRCPHGRPVWMEIGRETILKAVRRL